MIPKSFLDNINKNNINNNKLSYENIIYSNELVNDIKLLRKCNSLESLDNYINNRCNDMRLIDNLIDKENYKIKTIISLESLNIFSLEDNDINKNIFQKIINWIGNAISKFIAWILGILKKLMSIVKGKKLNYTIKEVISTFDESKFKYFNNAIKTYPLLNNKNDFVQNMLIPVSKLIENYLELQDVDIPDLDLVLRGVFTPKYIKEEYADLKEYPSEKYPFHKFNNDFCKKYYISEINERDMYIKDYLGDLIKENTRPTRIFMLLEKSNFDINKDVGRLKEIVSNAQKSAKDLQSRFKETHQKIVDDKIEEINGTPSYEIKRSLILLTRKLQNKLTFLTNVLNTQMIVYETRNNIFNSLAKAILIAQNASNDVNIDN